jgi:uncharacterized protein (TIGR00266 family)
MQFPVAKLLMASGDTARISNGSMIYRTQGVELSAKLNASDSSSGIGKFIKAAARSVVSGESVFITEVACSAPNGEIAIAPSCPGTIRMLEIGERQYRLNDAAFLAMEGTVEYTMQKQSFGKAFLGGTGGFFVMTTQGQGRMLVNSFGSIMEIDLQNEQGFAIDNGHVVAWDLSLDYEIELQSGFLGSIGTGEGLVNVFKGTGKVLVSSLNMENFASRLSQFITKDS